jgi:4-aminobutyrate aminotransferase-like enzyme
MGHGGLALLPDRVLRHPNRGSVGHPVEEDKDEQPNQRQRSRRRHRGRPRACLAPSDPAQALRGTDPRIIVEGKGMRVWDATGKEHLDGVSGGVWTVNVGYGREASPTRFAISW